jgi:hypothetical protein
MRLACAVSSVLLLILGLTLTQPASGDEKRQIKFNAKELSIRATLRVFSKLLGSTVEADPTVPDVPITVDISADGVDVAISQFVDAAAKRIPGLFHEAKGLGYVLKVRPGSPAPPKFVPVSDPAGLITFSCIRMPLRKAVALLYRQPGVPDKPPVRIEDDVPDVLLTLHASENDRYAVLRHLVRQASPIVPDVRLVKEGEMLVVGMRPGVRFESSIPNVTPAAKSPDRRIICGYKDTPSHDLLVLLTSRILPRFGKRTELHVAPNVPNVPVDLEVVSADEEMVLEQLLSFLKAQIRELEVEQKPGSLRLSVKNAVVCRPVRARCAPGHRCGAA